MMNKEEYIKQLKSNLLSLTEAEQEEALKYYSDYFDEANDDQKVIAELGSPEELAKTITEKFANALVGSGKEKSDDKEGTEEASYDSSSQALYYEFPKNAVKNLSMSFSTAEVVIISGSKYTVESRGIESTALNCHLGNDGTLTINNSKRLNFNFWSHDRNRRVVPRILVTVPNKAKLDKFRLLIGAGDCRTKSVDMTCQRANIEVGAGNLVMGSVYGGKVDFRCGMGNLSFEGSVKGRCNLDCGMGSVKLNLKGTPSDYSYDVKLGLGDFKFNNEKKSGVCKVFDNQVKENHLSVNCGMGSVNIQIG
ncbi:MAG: DUF4097 family beta strand repeat-containing protein [Treponema sp.]|nr:DUF4097 family beta strand repeat-containing protein [Treponema sp.]